MVLLVQEEISAAGAWFPRGGVRGAAAGGATVAWRSVVGGAVGAIEAVQRLKGMERASSPESE